MQTSATNYQNNGGGWKCSFPWASEFSHAQPAQPLSLGVFPAKQTVQVKSPKGPLSAARVRITNTVHSFPLRKIFQLFFLLPDDSWPLLGCGFIFWVLPAAASLSHSTHSQLSFSFPRFPAIWAGCLLALMIATTMQWPIGNCDYSPSSDLGATRCQAAPFKCQFGSETPAEKHTQEK